MLIKFILGVTIVISGATFFFVGWNNGFDVGVRNKQDTDIIRGKVTCKYTK